MLECKTAVCKNIWSQLEGFECFDSVTFCLDKARSKYKHLNALLNKTTKVQYATKHANFLVKKPILSNKSDQFVVAFQMSGIRGKHSAL